MESSSWKVLTVLTCGLKGACGLMFELIIYSGRQTTVKLITVLTLSDGYITIYEYSLVMHKT